MSHDLVTLLQQPGGPSILVVGDVILDRYLWGNVERISPEAPIPLLRVARRETRLGGAGSVSAMLAALEARVALVAVVGDDAEAREVGRLLAELGVDASAVLTVAGRPTTVKERLLGRAQSRHPQQMIRVDYEADGPLAAEAAERLLAAACARVSDVDLVLVSDYSKGVCAGDFVPRLVRAASQAGVRVVADPTRGGDYRRYAGCACITPNRLEAKLATGIEIVTPQDGLRAAERLLEFGVQAAVVTLDRDGMAWADARGRRGLFPVRPREVYDITGAGDMVLSVIGYCLAGGLDYPEVIKLANLAGGLEVEQLGAVPLSRDDVLAELTSGGHSWRRKIVSADELDKQLALRRQAGQRIVMTNGCFDLLHPGHVAALEAARRLGDCLVVGVNSDRSVARLKGPGRPIIDELGRSEMLAALGCIDFVTLFDDASVAGLVARVRPDVLAKSASYSTEEVVGHELVAAYGGQISLTPMQSDYSTRRLIDKILTTHAVPPKSDEPGSPGP